MGRRGSAADATTAGVDDSSSTRRCHPHPRRAHPILYHRHTHSHRHYPFPPRKGPAATEPARYSHHPPPHRRGCACATRLPTTVFPPAPTRPLPASAATAPTHHGSCGRQRGRGRLGIVTAAAAIAAAPPPTPPPLPLPLPLTPPLPLPRTLTLQAQRTGGGKVEVARMVGGRQ